jgi:hypothetical protein
MFAAGVQVSPNAIGGDPISHLASTPQAPSPNHDPESRTHGATESTPSDAGPAINQDTTRSRTIPNQKKPYDDPVPEKKTEKFSSVQPDEADAAKSPDEKFSRVDASPGPRAVRVVRACANCGVKAKVLEQGKLMECSSCRSVRYCGRACQKANWPAHEPHASVCKPRTRHIHPVFFLLPASYRGSVSLLTTSPGCQSSAHTERSVRTSCHTGHRSSFCA